MSIPVLDMKSDSFSTLFGRALEDFGFASIVNHGLNKDILKESYSAAEKVFSLPEEVKKKYETNKPEKHGYTSFGIEHAKDNLIPDLKEFWHVFRRNHPTKTPFPIEVPESRVWEELFSELEIISKRLLLHLDSYIGNDSHMRHWIQNGNSLLRVLHYPEVTGLDGIRSAAHEDINLITLLVAATKPGLQVKTKSGDWIDVNNPPEAIVVNAGDMLQMHTFGRFCSATHRVVNPEKPDGSRYSIPFFAHPRSDCALVTAGSYLNQRLKEIGLSS